MTDMNKIDLKGSMLMLVAIVGVYGAYNIVKFIILLVVGSTANTALSGSITVPTAIETVINTSVTNAGTGFTTIDGGVTLTLGLIGLVVIIRLFWGLIKNYMGGSKEKKKGNANF